MARKKPKRKKHQVRKKPGVTSGTTSPESGPIAPEKKQLKTISLVSGIVLDVILLVLALVLVIKLIGYAGEAKFFTDECFHNYIINLTVENGRVPARLPDIYSSKFDEEGKVNIEPPMFHAFGAIYKTLFGKAGLPYFNILFLVVLLVAMYTLIRIFVHANAARLSLLFIMVPSFMHEFSLVFYLEMLSGLTFFLGLFLLFIALEKKRLSFYIYAGLGGTAMILSKISGIAILPFYFIIFVFYGTRYLLKKEKFITMTGPVITAATSLVASILFFLAATNQPMSFAYCTFIRPVKPLVPLKLMDNISEKKKEERIGEKKIMKSKEHWTFEKKGDLLKNIHQRSGNLMLAALIIALVQVGVSLGRSRTLWIFIFFIYAFLTFLYSPAVAPRHFVAIMPLAAFLGGYALHDLAKKLNKLIFGKAKGHGMQIAKAAGIFGIICFLTLFAIDTAVVKNIPNYRAPLNNNVSLLLEPISFIRNNTPEDSLVFTMWAYSTLYHSGRAATWGANARGLKDIYFIENPEDLYKRCRDAGITHFLVDANRIFPDKAYNTVVFTTTMVKNLVEFIKSGKAEMIWPTPISFKNPDLVNGLTLGALPYGDRGRFEIFVKTPEGTARFINKSGLLIDYYVIKLNYDSEDDKGGGEEE